jgi:ornithine carbamoyltransferase
MFDGIEYRGFAQSTVETLGQYAGVPVWNGLTDEWHPTQMLADILTMYEHSLKHPTEIAYCYLGDARNNTARSLLITGAMLGMDVRIAAPPSLWPDQALRQQAEKIAETTGARVHVTDDVNTAVVGADFLYTDVWVSMGEAAEAWDERIALLLPYQVNDAVIAATKNSAVAFMHCLPALHDLETDTAQKLFEHNGMSEFEVTNSVFESPRSIVFDQAENRLHTIKAIMVATLGR